MTAVVCAAICTYVRIPLTVAALLFAAHARAADFAIAYDAPSECPSAEDFVADVRARAQIGSLPAPGQSFEVVVAHGATWDARLATSE